MTRLQAALAARTTARRRGDEGFTLIELLVVVIIIGILAAIAVPVYIGVQNNAKDAGTKNDLGNTKVAVVTYFGANPKATSVGVLDKTNTALLNAGMTISATTTSLAFVTTGGWSQPTSASDPFCIVGTSSTTTQFSISSSRGVVNNATCS